VQSDEQSSNLETALLDGSMPVDVFLEEYVRLRAEFHSRDIKYRTALQTIAGVGGRRSVSLRDSSLG
jgi:hypothetical protein